jgi:uncharacterized protein (TIGR03067 family)
MVGNWLYGVAHQTALKARATVARRAGRERQVATLPEPAAKEHYLWCDLQPFLDEELSHLPNKYRAVLVHCDLEGKTRKEAARQLNVPEGTVAGRLARARTMLAKRLARRGLTVSAGSLVAAVSEQAAAGSVPSSVVSSTIKAAITFAAGKAGASELISVKVAVLTEGVLRAMFMTKLKSVMVLTLGMAALVGVGGGLMGSGMTGEQTDNKKSGAIVSQKEVAQNDKDNARGKAKEIDLNPPAEAEKQANTNEGEKLAEELIKLQGTWSLVLQQWKGHDVDHGPGTLIVKGDSVTVIWEGVPRTWTIKTLPSIVSPVLGTAKKTNAIDLFCGGDQVLGIYKLEGDTLVLCQGNKERPIRFAAEADSENSLFIFRRVQSAASQTQAAKLPKELQGNKTTTAPSSRQEVRPPKVAAQREYVIRSRLMEAGRDQPKELPKVTVDEGQRTSLHIVDGPHNLLDRVVVEEEIKIGTFLDMRVNHLWDNKARLVLSFQRNEVEQPSLSEIRVIGNSVQAIQDLELRKPAKFVFQKDAEGAAQRWIEITVDAGNIPAPPLAPPP